MANYFQKHISKMSTHAHSLYSLPQKNVRLDYTKEHQSQFKNIKQLVTDCNKNHIFNLNEEFFMFTDASRYRAHIQFGYKDSKGNFKTVAYASASLSTSTLSLKKNQWLWRSKIS